MKRYLTLIILIVASLYSEAQNIFPLDINGGNVGIGTVNPAYRLQLFGGHADTKLNLHFNHQTPGQEADLTLWASEPGWTYTGTGIGNNVNNVNGIVRINSLKGGSYMRLLDQEIRLNVIKTDGTDLPAFYINPDGNIGVGTNYPTEKLSVKGKIRSQEVKVEMANWPDYVFLRSYELPPLKEVERHIKMNGHLQGIPSAAEVSSNGIDLGNMNAKLLQKIEELTLYLIEIKKENQEIKERLIKLEKHNL